MFFGVSRPPPGALIFNVENGALPYFAECLTREQGAERLRCYARQRAAECLTRHHLC